MNSHTPIAPPTARDFEIFEQNQIAFLSTRRVAENHRLSQTRVRQIVTRVANWLAAHLPAKTEAEKEADIRLAQHLAAAQLRRQIEQCQNYFDGSGDPKYLRHQTRVIVALSRLGVVPGAIDSLAADFTSTENDLVTRVPPGNALPRGSSLAEAPTTPPPPDPCPLTPAPSLRACSPAAPSHPEANTTDSTDPAATPDDFRFSDESMLDPETTLQGLATMERRLLTLLDETPSNNHDRRSSLQESLENVRRNQAIFQLRLSPGNPGATIVEPARTDMFAPAAVDSRI